MSNFTLAILLFLPCLSLEAKEGLSLGLVYERLEYVEPNLMNEKGELPGLSLAYSYPLQNKLYVDASLSYFEGSLDYDGSTFSGTPIEVDTEDWIYYLSFLFRLDTDYQNLSLFAGLENRVWFNDLVISYTRKTEYYYLPIGFRYDWQNQWAFKVQYNLWLAGKNTSRMSIVNPSRNDVELKQNSGKGYKVNLQRSFANSNFSLSLFYEFWNVDSSEPAFDGIDVLVEPENETKTYGLRLIYHFQSKPSN